jgi:predicted helicase
MAQFFPDASTHNFGIELTGPSSHYEFAPFITDNVPDLHLLDTGMFFPRYTFSEPDPDDLFAGDTGRRIDNISNRALVGYQNTYGSNITKDDIFYYVYGLLHSPDYRVTFAADLKKMLPRVPQVASSDDFEAFSAAGRKLATLHIGYENIAPYPLTINSEASDGLVSDHLYNYYRVDKMRFGGKAASKDRSVIIYNSQIAVSGIPDVAHEYLLGPRSGIEWVMERYQVKTDKASGIVNDPNDWSREVGDPRYILDLLARVVTVSVETRRIVDGLPTLSLG